jgi:tripartite-type tricarboxylate transporter receptor subunit TctC
MQDLIAGRIDYMCPTITTAMAQLQAHAVQAPAVIGSERSQVFPDIPTAEEQGLKGFAANSWNALFAPKGTAPAIVAKLNAAALKAMDTPSVQQHVRELGASLPSPEHRTPQYLQSLVESEIRTWGDAAQAAGITAE